MSDMGEIRVVLYAMQSELGACRADVGSLLRSIDLEREERQGVEARLRKNELDIAHAKGRATVIGGLVAFVCSFSMELAKRAWT